MSKKKNKWVFVFELIIFLTIYIAVIYVTFINAYLYGIFSLMLYSAGAGDAVIDFLMRFGLIINALIISFLILALASMNGSGRKEVKHGKIKHD